MAGLGNVKAKCNGKLDLRPSTTPRNEHLFISYLCGNNEFDNNTVIYLKEFLKLFRNTLILMSFNDKYLVTCRHVMILDIINVRNYTYTILV